MFTGLIESTGLVERIDTSSAGRRLRIASDLGAELRPGDSVATSGVCLTVTHADSGGFSADLSPETLRVTSLGSIAEGRRLNLERPLRADARLGGHFVLGHVDAVGQVRSLQRDGVHHWIEIDYPAALATLLIPKGSIAVDGISLTIASLSAGWFAVQVVPFTWEHTALGSAQPGDAVNLEADVLGKYVVRLLELRGISS
jgi:riboflavin synthase